MGWEGHGTPSTQSTVLLQSPQSAIHSLTHALSQLVSQSVKSLQRDDRQARVEWSRSGSWFWLQFWSVVTRIVTDGRFAIMPGLLN